MLSFRLMATHRAPMKETHSESICVFDSVEEAAQVVAAMKFQNVAVTRCELLDSSSDDSKGQTQYIRDGILWNVPSDAFVFADIPFARDHLQFDAFRHAMMIPNDMFPDIWKNESPTKTKGNPSLERRKGRRGTETRS